MSRADPYRHARHMGVGVVLAALALVACAPRQGPPAPVVDRSGIYFTSPAAPVPPVRPVPRGKVSAAPLPAAPSVEAVPAPAPVTAAELAPAGKAGEPPLAGGTVAARQGGVVKVTAGETLYAISRREKIPIRALIEANNLRPPYGLRAGQALRVPSVRVYVVAPGDTVYAISRRFEAGINDIIRENGLAAPDYGLYAGQRLVLPWQGAARGGDVEVAQAGRSAAALKVELADPGAPPPPRAGRKFLWPLQGEVVSSFGAKGGGLYNDGINIAAKEGAIVRAAENGVVAYAGNELRGYGNLLLVRHAGGWISAYAHNGELLVRRGQVVKRGQPIARVGRSGAASHPQLHFELRQGRKAVDPRGHLTS